MNTDSHDAPRERLELGLRYIMAQTHVPHIHDTASSLLAIVQQSSASTKNGQLAEKLRKMNIWDEGTDTYETIEAAAKALSPPSETERIPASPAATPMTDTLERTTLNPADWIALSRTLELKNADLRGQIRGLQAIAENLRIAKQREADELRRQLAEQTRLRQMADHERDAMLEKLIVADKKIFEAERAFLNINMETSSGTVSAMTFAAIRNLKEST